MRVGILTGGGDCPGLNAVIRAVVRRAHRSTLQPEILGYRYGWRGVLRDDWFPLGVENTRGILLRGGTILGTSRTNPLKEGSAAETLVRLGEAGVDALVAIGGEDTLGVAASLAEEGGHVVGVPKTIDNDLSVTEMTFGFDTAVEIATEAIDRIQTTAESHNRVIVVEVMGRHAGHIAAWSGLAGGADEILVPELEFDIEDVCAAIQRRHERGIKFSVIVVSEGATPKAGTLGLQSGEVDEFGHVRLGGIANVVAREIESRTGFETRVSILGHIQRGGTPTAFDRVLASRFGVAAWEAVEAEDWGKMVALRCGDIVRVPLADATGTLKAVDQRILDVAATFFG
ncbi:MAG: ATP-dependent 6-phosphofructokinase [Acidimicrobiia bacterium]|nr:ATP-dependent 6-phosphofructokinase [Acidimicrobiia bacterium]